MLRAVVTKTTTTTTTKFRFTFVLKNEMKRNFTLGLHKSFLHKSDLCRIFTEDFALRKQEKKNQISSPTKN